MVEKTFSPKTFEKVQKLSSILHAFVGRPSTNLVEKYDFWKRLKTLEPVIYYSNIWIHDNWDTTEETYSK